jgi:hypothetical protein
MAHLKCLACTTRFYRADSEADSIGDLCPVCGSLLEPVGAVGGMAIKRAAQAPISLEQPVGDDEQSEHVLLGVSDLGRLRARRAAI